MSGLIHRRLPVRPAIVLVGIVLAGCAISIPTVKTFEAGQSVAFGTVEVVSAGKKIEDLWDGTVDARIFSVILLRPGQDKADQITLARSGEFYWDVGPGEYTLVALQFIGTGGSTRNLHLGMKFRIPEAPTSVCIGNLLVLIDGYRHAIGTADRCDEAMARLPTAYPGHPVATTRDLIIPEPPLGNVSAVRSACAPEWGGADCKSSQHGVKPLTPEHQSGRFAVVQTLTPTFAWSPSSRTEVHYDLVIRKSVACRDAVTFKEGLIGDVVAYRENLSEPTHRLDEPLEPGTNYIWSVRFREGDVVSDWSSTGRFVFFVVGYSARSGDWFRFCTPPGG
jgi:hypothetical protein